MIRVESVRQFPRSAAASGIHGRPFGRLGFSLVEVIVAITLFGVSMSAIAALMFAVTRQSAATAGTVERTAVLEARANDLFSIPFTALAARAGCTTITALPFPRTECITVTAVNANRSTIQLTVTPKNTKIRATTVKVERTRPPATNPFRVVL